VFERPVHFLIFLAVFSAPVVLIARVQGLPWWQIGACFAVAVVLVGLRRSVR